MTATVSLPRKGDVFPVINPAVDVCADCGDIIAWCPVWCQRWPELETHRGIEPMALCRAGGQQAYNEYDLENVEIPNHLHRIVCPDCDATAIADSAGIIQRHEYRPH